MEVVVIITKTETAGVSRIGKRVVLRECIFLIQSNRRPNIFLGIYEDDCIRFIYMFVRACICMFVLRRWN